MDKKISSTLKEYRVLFPYLSDNRRGFHVREIAREMKMNHRTAGLALDRLETHGVLRHETKGRNKIYYLSEEKPYITKPYIINVEAQRRAAISKNNLLEEMMKSLFLPPVVKDSVIILFGSYARGDFSKESDIDILIIGKNEKAGESLMKFGATYRKNMSIKTTSVNDFAKNIKKKDPLLLEILEDHVILSNENAFVEILWGNFYG
ncbi:nucleotidyltransferase domain-containing protein [bacterium]|nr:nucleotidyltransferase domain-containing protein [bacterium]